jgi:hypothetical protein
MKKLIHEVAEVSGATYQLWAELNDCYHPAGYKELRFSSVWTGAKDPEAPYNKGKFFLSPEALTNLKTLLETA